MVLLATNRYAVVAAAELAAAARWSNNNDGVGGVPIDGACLYNSMLHPLLSLPVAGILWYQVRRTCARAHGSPLLAL